LRRPASVAPTPRGSNDSGSSPRPAPPSATASSQPVSPVSVADMPLRRTVEPPKTAPAIPREVPRELVAAGNRVAPPRTAATAAPRTTVSAERRSPIAPLPASPGRAPGAPEFRRQVVAFRSEPPRAVSAWNRVKEVFFGMRTETGGR
jgi:hypothetical protein